MNKPFVFEDLMLATKADWFTGTMVHHLAVMDLDTIGVHGQEVIRLINKLGDYGINPRTVDARAKRIKKHHKEIEAWVATIDEWSGMDYFMRQRRREALWGVLWGSEGHLASARYMVNLMIEADKNMGAEPDGRYTNQD